MNILEATRPNGKKRPEIGQPSGILTQATRHCKAAASLYSQIMLRGHHLATLFLMSVIAVRVPAAAGQSGRPPAAPPDRASAEQPRALAPADARLLDAAMRGDVAEV